MDEPWKDEPDALDFIDDETGYPVALRRNQWGAWCGYVGVPRDHPWFEQDYSAPVRAPQDAIERPVSIDQIGAINLLCASAKSNPAEGIYPIDVLVRCHGGLTYAAKAWWEGETRSSWWFGFDCSHVGDLAPKLRVPGIDGDIYRDIEYVRAAASMAASDLAHACSASAPSDIGKQGS